MKWADRIVWDPEICHGKPTIRGTRVMISIVAANLAAGHSDEVILENYPTISADDIRAVVMFLADFAAGRLDALKARRA